MTGHVKALTSPYPGSQVERQPVPPGKGQLVGGLAGVPAGRVHRPPCARPTRLGRPPTQRGKLPPAVQHPGRRCTEDELRGGIPGRGRAAQKPHWKDGDDGKRVARKVGTQPCSRPNHNTVEKERCRREGDRSKDGESHLTVRSHSEEGLWPVGYTRRDGGSWRGDHGDTAQGVLRGGSELSGEYG
ncbi:unnamed protein product [Staurois parvus]|uniref:Uncharacterized protein n=1 Tax=Staurois parvus TaxID=386267 RepID=A0ABN9A6W9_9NEOB|nr:unnamed protein product [Staurois parvus]